MGRMKKLHTSMSGLTLVELLVTVSIAAILIAIAAPSFNDSNTRRKIAAEQRNMKLELAFARSEAISRNAYITICSSDDGVVCLGSADWSEGWVVFVDDGAGAGSPKDGQRSGNEELLRVYMNENSQTSLTAFDVDNRAVHGITYSARGYIDVVQRGLGLSTLPPKRLTYRICGPINPGGLEDMFARGVLLEITGRAIDSFDNDLNGIHEDIEQNDFDC